MYENERWVPLIGYEGRYMVSDYGRVKRLWDSPYTSRHRKIKSYDKIFEPHKANNGYMRTSYEMKREYTHRLVARHFCPNPDNLPEVNHIDGNKKNNYYANLEWCSRKDNCEHASKTGLINRESEKRKVACAQNQKIAASNSMKPIYQLDFIGNIIQKYDSVKAAAKALGTRGQAISAAALHRCNHLSCMGYQWVYVSDYDPNKDYTYTGKH